MLFGLITFLYCALAAATKDFKYLLVFLLAECLVIFESPLLSECEVYMLIFIVWSIVTERLYKSYVIKKTKMITVLSCVIICLLSIAYAIDVYLYGVGGIHGESKTYLYENIEYIAVFCHAFFVSTFINITKCRDGFRDMLYSFRSLSSYSYYFNFI
jgi:hypothetical protein